MSHILGSYLSACESVENINFMSVVSLVAEQCCSFRSKLWEITRPGKPCAGLRWPLEGNVISMSQLVSGLASIIYRVSLKPVSEKASWKVGLSSERNLPKIESLLGTGKGLFTGDCFSGRTGVVFTPTGVVFAPIVIPKVAASIPSTAGWW